MSIIFTFLKVVAVAVFTPAEEVQRSLVAPWDMAEKVARDFFREEWVEEPRITMLTEGLGEVPVLMELEEVVVAGEGTLVEAVEKLQGTPVEEGEVPLMMEQTSKKNVVTTQLAMVR